MPEVFRFFGFPFFFYSKEHEPVHVHVEGNGGMAKFVWNGSELINGIRYEDYKDLVYC